MDQEALAQQVKLIQDQLQELQRAIAPPPPVKPLFEQLLARVQQLEQMVKDSASQPELDLKPLDLKPLDLKPLDLKPQTSNLTADAEQILRASEEKWRALSVCSPVGIFTCDVRGRVNYTNPRCREIGGLTLEESLGEGFAEFIHPNDRDRVLSAWFAIAQSGQQHADEFRVLQPDGSLRWVKMRTAPILSDLDELIGHTGTIEDITKQKQDEEQIKASLKEKEALLKEIHHRVKNNLQIISSLIYLQAQRIDDPHVRQIFEDSQSRISSMALVHDSLYRSDNLTMINLSEYIQTLATSLFYTYRIQSELVQLRLDIDPEVLVSLETAIPCGLILNELMTNALKHGFADGRQGEIAVLLEIASQTKIRLVVENDGSNLPNAFELQTIRSMGLRLVHALVNQLQGTLDLDRTTKTRFEVTFDHS
jgi:PAS domain S-box-containing protein